MIKGTLEGRDLINTLTIDSVELGMDHTVQSKFVNLLGDVTLHVIQDAKDAE